MALIVPCYRRPCLWTYYLEQQQLSDALLSLGERAVQQAWGTHHVADPWLHGGLHCVHLQPQHELHLEMAYAGKQHKKTAKA